jgi:REP element-mobilizing transposase RayT
MTQISEPKFRGHALRKGRVSITNQIYAITVVTRNRKHYFADFNSSRTLINVLRSDERTGDANALCFVVMPDHFHWLMQLQERKNLSATVQSVKSKTTKALGFPVWQKVFHDRAIRHEDDLVDIARYIVANPIRAGLVNSIKEYPHWDAIWLP